MAFSRMLLVVVGRCAGLHLHSRGPRQHRPMFLHSSRLESALLSEMTAPTTSTDAAALLLRDWLEEKSRVVVLTGAGVSTRSGIPDYRGAGGAYRQGHRPQTHDEFVASEDNRRRYWTRALVGYDEFARARPNAAHDAVAALQGLGIASTVITQNVDGLHEQTSDDVVALHGRGDRVVCLTCGATGDRGEYHALLKERNAFASVPSSPHQQRRPDGDAELRGGAKLLTELPPCAACGTGTLKPDVVFFGDTVPQHRVDRCYDALRHADGLLVCGSSLAVYSAFRFVLYAAGRSSASSRRLPICVLNRGTTRADLEAIPMLKLDADLDALSTSVELLSS